MVPQSVALRPVTMLPRPAFARNPVPAAAMPISLAGRPQPKRLGQTFDQIFGWPAWAGDAFRLFFHASTAYLGIYVGTHYKPGFLKYFGWFLGLGQGIAAVCDAASLVKRATGTHPPEQPAAIPPAPAPASPPTEIIPSSPSI